MPKWNPLGGAVENVKMKRNEDRGVNVQFPVLIKALKSHDIRSRRSAPEHRDGNDARNGISWETVEIEKENINKMPRNAENINRRCARCGRSRTACASSPPQCDGPRPETDNFEPSIERQEDIGTNFPSSADVFRRYFD